jgi:hypothetical protein
MTTFHCLRFATPSETGWPSYTPRQWVPFSSPPTTRRATVEVFDHSSAQDDDSIFKVQHGPHRKRLFHYCVFSRCRENNGFTELLPSNGCYTVAYLQSCYLTIGLHGTIYRVSREECAYDFVHPPSTFFLSVNKYSLLHPFPSILSLCSCSKADRP